MIHDNTRLEVADAAARIMAEQGVRDFAQAKQKAMSGSGLGRGQAPSNLEIAQCLKNYLELFDGEAWRQRLATMREVALQAMDLCQAFTPRAVGAVENELATQRSVVQLHVFCAYDELLDLFLSERNIPFDSTEKRFRHPDGREIFRPCCVFVAGETEVEISIFAEDDVRWSPLSVIDGRPMRRLSRSELHELRDGQKKTA